MPGAVALVGGDEFSVESRAFNQGVLRLVNQSAPRLVVVPAAAADNPRKAVRKGGSYFNALGAKAEHIMIVDAETANDAVASAALETAHIIYLPDGNPLDAVRTLAGSEALAKLQRAWDSGTILAASGAAAMALCDLYWDSGAWEQGLGVVKGIVVLPHYERLSARFSPDRLRAALPAGYMLLGLDDATGVIIQGQRARVAGPETVTVYLESSEKEYTDGGSFDLPAALTTQL